MDCDPPDHFQIPPAMIKLKSSDGETFEVEVEAAKLSLNIKEMLDDLGVEMNDVIPIPQNAPEINGAILKKIIQWANHHKDDTAAADEEKVKSTSVISSWDVEFLKVDETTLIQMIRAANYLNIRGLLEVACKKVAKMMKGMTLEEVRQKLHIHKDFTQEQEEQIRKENSWCEEFRLGVNGRRVPGNVMDKILANSVQNVNNEGGDCHEDCLTNALVVIEIIQHLPDLELVVFSGLNTMWNHEARSELRKRSNIIASLDCNGSCQVVQDFTEDLRQMNIVPFCGMRIVLPDGDDSCQCSVSALSPTDDVIFDPLPFKTLSVQLGGKRGVKQYCRGFLLAKKILQSLSVVVEELSLLVSSNSASVIEHYVQECSFPRLKILKLEDMDSGSLTNEDYLKYFKVLISSAPSLREMHSDRSIWVLLDLVEGSAVVPVYSGQVCLPFFGISDHVVNSAIRLQRLRFVSTDYPSFDYPGLNNLIPMLLQAPCASTLCELTVDAVLAGPLMSYGVCLENVRKLTMGIDYHKLERNQRNRFLRIVQYFDFNRICPSLTRVHITKMGIPQHLPESLNEFVLQANAHLREPMPDRAVNIKELHLHDGRALDSNSAQFFAKMFPNIERLYVESVGEEDYFKFGSICEYWADLKELHIKSKFLEDTANFDCTFCGILFDEVAQLMQRDDEYLKRVNIVPVSPSVACLKNLRVLSLEYDLGRRPDPTIYDVTNPTFFLSKVTKLVALARCPNLDVTLKISPDGAHAGEFAKINIQI